MTPPTATSLRQHYVQVLKLQPACSSEEITARLATSTPEELLELDRRLQDAGVDAFLAESDPKPGIVELDDEPMQFDEAGRGRGAPYLRQMLRRAGMPEDRWVRYDDQEMRSLWPPLTDAESANALQAVRARATLLLSLVASLPDFERQVVTLVAFDGLSHSQASKRLNVPEDRVSSAFNSAVTMLERGLLQARKVSAAPQVPEVLVQALALRLA